MNDDAEKPGERRAIRAKSRIPAISSGPRARRDLGRTLRDATITVLGLVALFTPLSLWLAWSTTAFKLLLLTGCGAIAGIFILVRFSKDEYL